MHVGHKKQLFKKPQLFTIQNTFYLYVGIFPYLHLEYIGRKRYMDTIYITQMYAA